MGFLTGLNLTLNGNAVKEGKSYTQAQIDKMEIRADDNLAGRFEFEITAVATEVWQFTFADPNDKTAEYCYIPLLVDISPDADTPHVSVKDYKGLEDEAILPQETLLKDRFGGHRWF